MKAGVRTAEVPKQRDRGIRKTRRGRRNGLNGGHLAGRLHPATHAKTLPPATPDEVSPKIRVGRLRTVADWHKQVAKVYRAMRKGYLPKEDGTRLTYVANIGAQLAKYKDEMKEIERIREQLEVLKAGTPLALPPPEDTEDTTP